MSTEAMPVSFDITPPPIEDVSDWIQEMLVVYGRPTVENGIEWSRAHLNEAIASTVDDDELSILNAQLDFYEEAAMYLGRSR